MTRHLLAALVCAVALQSAFVYAGEPGDLLRKAIRERRAKAVKTETAQKAPAEKIKALIIDGQNNHNWRATTPVLKDILEKSGRFSVDVATAPTKKDKEADAEKYKKDLASFKPDFAKYDVIVGNYNSSETGDEWSDETRKAFDGFIKNGGGYVSYHAADNSFRHWESYHKIIGVAGWYKDANTFGKYVFWKDGKQVEETTPGRCGSHGPQHEFLITVRDPNHPITKGLPAQFMHCKDELYDSLRGPGENLSIKATAFAAKDKGGTDKDEPMLMTIEYGKGRVFHTTLGHAAEMLRSVSFITTFLRGTEWSATGKVTIPVPDDFPGKEKPAFRQ
ncbi:MAG: ThuA domain-containing protein [Planctomycetaceae bacterium]|jgi:type 1 glutamine amidotransferase|nr:ThuA domain-containing protein [Planctomycetaceae bacterium]